jgi:thiamine biosynthesis lipoprotein
MRAMRNPLTWQRLARRHGDAAQHPIATRALERLRARPEPDDHAGVVSFVDDSFDLMGGAGRVRLESELLDQDELELAAARVRGVLDEAESALTRFRPASELCALNRDPRASVPVSPIVAALVRAAIAAGDWSGGLVDATLADEIESVGYRRTRAGEEPAPLTAALAAAPRRRPARARRSSGLSSLEVREHGRVTRPLGVRIDSGGIAKGMAADLAAATVPDGVRYAISCCGDLAVGGPPGPPWQVAVTSARTGLEAHRLLVPRGGVATSAIHNRIWRRADGSYVHHLLDPSTGEPAWTGVVAATAVAPSGLDAEVLAKTALLSGPDAGRRLLGRHGGVIQHDGGAVEVVPALRVPRLAAAA